MGTTRISQKRRQTVRQTRFFRAAQGIAFSVAIALSGCGYALQNSHSPLADKEGVHRIYVKPLVNNSYKAGVENLVYNTLLRTISAGRRVELVSSPEEADAVLVGTIDTAMSSVVATATGNTLNAFPSAAGNEYLNNNVASIYSATLSCTFTLNRSQTLPGKRQRIWNSAFSRVEFFPASNQLGSYGTTSPLINDSEFDRALGDLARSMMGDVHESMLAMF
jgi:hypothetical protein